MKARDLIRIGSIGKNYFEVITSRPQLYKIPRKQRFVLFENDGRRIEGTKSEIEIYVSQTGRFITITNKIGRDSFK